MSTVNCCWYSDQNTALVMNIGMNAITRLRSSLVIRLLPRITTKYATLARMEIATTLVASRSASRTPVSASTTTSATTPAVIKMIRIRSSAGSGLGT